MMSRGFQTNMVTFPEPIGEELMTYDIDASGAKMDQVRDLQETVAGRVMHFRTQEGMEGHPAQWTTEARERLFALIHGDREWHTATAALITQLFPDLQTDKPTSQLIYQPNWTDSRLIATSISLGSDGVLHTRFALSHSYASQVSESMALPKGGLKQGVPSTSVIGVVCSSDSKYPVDLRGGGRWRDVWHLAPAGFVDLNPRGSNTGNRHPLIANWYSERRDELGLSADDTSGAQCIGVVVTNVFEVGNGNLNFVFADDTSQSSSGIDTAHQSSAAHDRDEHQRLHYLTLEGPEDIFHWVENTRFYDPTKTDLESPAKTTKENEGSVMPQAPVALLAIAQSSGVDRQEIARIIARLQAKHPEQHIQMSDMPIGVEVDTSKLLST